MANPSEAWEQAQGRHVNQMHGVIGLLREASRTAKVPGEDQNGFSNRAVHEGRRAFFQAVDSIKFDQKTGKASFVLPGVRLGDDEDSGMQVCSAGMGDDSRDRRGGNSVENDGSLSMEDYDSDFNSSESDHGGLLSSGRIVSPNMNTDHPGTLQHPSKASVKIAGTQQHASTATGPRTRGTEGFSGHEPQKVSSSTGVLIKRELSVDYSPIRARQANNLTLDKAIATEVSPDEADVIPAITKLEKLLASLKLTAIQKGFKSFGHFARVLNTTTERVSAGLPKQWIVRFPITTAHSGRRKRGTRTRSSQGQEHRSVPRPYERRVGLEHDSGECWVIPRDEFTSSQSEQVPDLPEYFHGASKYEQIAFRRHMLKCKTMKQLIDWMNTIKSQSTGYYNTAIDNVQEICKAQSGLTPPNPFPDNAVLLGALQVALNEGCDVQDTLHWKEWQDSLSAGPSNTNVLPTES